MRITCPPIHLDNVGVTRAFFFNCDEHAFFLVCRIMFGQNTQQWTQLEPPLMFRDTLSVANKREKKNHWKKCLSK